jgi:hypothetical protein
VQQRMMGSIDEPLSDMAEHRSLPQLAAIL